MQKRGWYIEPSTLAFETRVLSALPDWGFVIEGQASLQVAFGGAGATATA